MTKTIAQIQTEALAAVGTVFDPLILEIEIYVDRLQAAGEDPSNYFDLESNSRVNFLELLANRKAAKQEAIAEILAQFSNQPLDQPVPPTAEATWFDAVATVLKLVVGRGIRINFEGITFDSSKPLHQFAEQLRDTILKELGVENNDFVRLLIDPGSFATDLGEEAAAQAQVVLENARRELARASENVARESAQVLENARREAEAAAQDVIRAVLKAPKVKVRVRIKIKKPKFKW